MEITFKDHRVTRQAVPAALHEFDAQYPDPDGYDNWLSKGPFVIDGRFYPPKHILSLVTGIPTTDFRSGDRIRSVFRRLGFEVVDK